MASPSSVCLGCCSVCFCSPLLTSFTRSSLFSSSLWFVLCLCRFVGEGRLFLFVLSCSCLLLVLMSWGGYLRGWVCMLRCLCLLSCFVLLQRKPERCFLVHSMLASSSLVPSSCFLSTCWFCACLFSGARARAAMASPRLRHYISLRRSLAVSSPPLSSPSCSICSGSCCSPSWLMHPPLQLLDSSDARKLGRKPRMTRVGCGNASTI